MPGRAAQLSRRASLPLLACAAAAALLAGCASSGARPTRRGYEQRGIASWYGDDFHGRPTASGETYDMHALSAAHRTLPLGTWIEVVNLDNGRRLVVRINDRGPFVHGRIVDLSLAAAEQLDMVRAGTAHVRLRVVAGPRGAPAPGEMWIQLGAFRERSNAERLAAELQRSHPDVRITANDDLYRVRLPPQGKPKRTEAVLRQLRRAGYEAILVPPPPAPPPRSKT